MKIGIVGLGLIGGSFAKAYSKKGHRVFALDIDRKMLEFSMISGAVEGELTDDVISDCDLILVCAYPRETADFMREKAAIFGEKPVVMDCCGTKEVLDNVGRQLSKEFGFTYVGAHPMAGTEFSGFKHARADLFEGAPMVIVPEVYDDIELLDRIKGLVSPAGFGSISVTTAKAHDAVIAYTSQLAHVVSNAFVKSPAARRHEGFSAGSYRDLTRVARLNPTMWSELFLENRVNLAGEIDILIENLKEYRDALNAQDEDKLIRLLAEGSNIKKEIDG